MRARSLSRESGVSRATHGGRMERILFRDVVGEALWVFMPAPTTAMYSSDEKCAFTRMPPILV